MLKELREQLDNKQVSSVELTQQYLSTITKQDSDINAYIQVTEEYAMEQAQKADAVIAAGNSSALTGIPYALKDNICVTGIETTAASNILKGYVPPYTATVVQRLDGAVMLGKSNTDEFTMGASTETSAFGVTKNPHDHSRVAGGSSGGPTAAVAADMAVFGIGTDTGGSLRQPAAFCGVVGLRPTYGRVSRYGSIPMASSLDTVGPVTSSVEDMAIVMNSIAGVDSFDGTTVDHAVPDYTVGLEDSIAGLKVGIPKEYIETEGISADVLASFESAKSALEAAGATCVEVSLPHTKYAVPTYYIVVPSEVSSNMARFDGIKYGARVDAEELVDIYAQSRAAGFGEEVKRRIMIGTYTLSSGYYDAYYRKAMQVRTLIRQDFDTAFQEVDILLTPTTTGPAFTIGANQSDPTEMYLQDVFTAPSALAGLPAIAVPHGASNGLPLGVQLIGPQFSEQRLFQVGTQVEKG